MIGSPYHMLSEIQIKTMIHHWIPISMARAETVTTLNAGKDAEQHELSYHWWECKNGTVTSECSLAKLLLA